MVALGIGPVGIAFYVWDIGMKRGDIRVLGAASYADAAPLDGFLVLAGYAPTATLALWLAALMIAGGGLIAAKDMLRRGVSRDHPSGAHRRRANSKRCKIESGRDGAADQRPVASAFGGLPRMSRNDRLRLLVRRQVGAKSDHALTIVVSDPQRQRFAGVVVPDLDRIDAVPVRALALCQQEVDRRRGRASAINNSRIAKCFAIVPAFGMRLQPEARDDFVGGEGGQAVHHDLFLRSRISPNTSAALLPLMPSRAPPPSDVGAQEDVGFFLVADQVVGIVGWFAARSLATSSARAFSAGLLPSMPSANLTFDAVYSWPQ